MNWRDYFFGTRVILRSPLTPDEIQRRIKEETKVPWWSRPFQTGPVGKVARGKLSLRLASSPLEYNAKPILVGPVERTVAGTDMRLVYRGSTSARIYLAFWYSILALVAVGFLVLGTDRPLHGFERFLPIAVIVVMGLVPIVMHAVGTRRSDEELAQLLGFLEEVIEAKPSRE